jgi:hypothetical protein
VHFLGEICLQGNGKHIQREIQYHRIANLANKVLLQQLYHMIQNSLQIHISPRITFKPEILRLNRHLRYFVHVILIVDGLCERDIDLTFVEGLEHLFFHLFGLRFLVLVSGNLF